MCLSPLSRLFAITAQWQSQAKAEQQCGELHGLPVKLRMRCRTVASATMEMINNPANRIGRVDATADPQRNAGSVS